MVYYAFFTYYFIIILNQNTASRGLWVSVMSFWCCKFVRKFSPAYAAPPAALPCHFQKKLQCPSKLLYKQLPDNSRLYACGAGPLFLRWDGELKEVSAETSQVGAAGDSPKRHTE